ncbi:MAG TPA: hypothetical protein VE953_09210 [Terriglobales bacterium]|nr:hypothetical protein [Terriglobales bacterium]
MLVVGGQFPFRDGYVIGPEGAHEWVQRGHAGQRDAVQLPTIIRECRPLPSDEWAHFAIGIEQSGILDVVGNPWAERLVDLRVASVAEPLLDLLTINSSWNPAKVPPNLEPR